VALLNDTTAIDSGFSTDILQLRYTAAVPEPTTGAFVFIGAASLALMRRHRSARAAR
jgi:hypothetical protein